jgi:GT2 family glycosyltransferase
MNVFGMVTTRHSHAFTAYALESFFRTTPFGLTDLFVLIDNDGTYPGPGGYGPAVTRLTNAAPLGFAANVNQVLRIARARRADLFFLNNDLIFPPGWLEPLLVGEPGLLSPVSNFQFPYRVGAWACGPVLDLADYQGHEDHLHALARAHQARHSGAQPALNLPFFCIKIPAAVQEAVGLLDKGFGPGGGEDYDYCLRCHLAGVPVRFALRSYVLHFMGKSTWRGAETLAQRRRCEQHYLAALQAKWGEHLLDVLIRGNTQGVRAFPEVAAAFTAGDFRALIGALVSGGNTSGQRTPQRGTLRIGG